MNLNKTYRKIILSFPLVLTSLLLLFIGVGCAKKSSNKNPVVAATPIPTDSPYVDATIPGAPGSVDSVYSGATYSKGATTDFHIVNDDEFNIFVATHPVEPENVVINIDLKEVPTRGAFAGTVKIHYQSSGKDYEAQLKSGTKSYDGKDYFMYNKFFTHNGKKVFTGLFEDTVGAIALVFDNTVDLGDGAGPSQLSGSVWYKNYTKAMATYDAGAGWSVVLPCWFRTIGPYDCRNNIVMNKTGIVPDSNGYRKLGTFSNVNRIKALNLLTE